MSSVALERCQQTLIEYWTNPGFAILPTGGFGPHFNRSPEPHAHLTRRWRLEHNVPAWDVLEPVLSRFTLEDAELSKPVIEHHGTQHLKIVTSDFHIPRAEFIFGKVFPDYRLSFGSSTTRLPRRELERLLGHEQAELARLTGGGNAL